MPRAIPRLSASSLVERDDFRRDEPGGYSSAQLVTSAVWLSRELGSKMMPYMYEAYTGLAVGAQVVWK
jgi:hypothetical protein